MPTNMAGILTYGVQQNHNKSTAFNRNCDFVTKL